MSPKAAESRDWHSDRLLRSRRPTLRRAAASVCAGVTGLTERVGPLRYGLASDRVDAHALADLRRLRLRLTGPPVWFYNAPSSSMAETIMVGDVYLADIDVYARKDPQRGDVALFHPHAGDPTVYAKRVIGLPGDRVQMVDGRLVLNGTPVSREPGPDGPIAEAPPGARRYLETLPNGVRYETLDFEEGGFLDNTQAFEVPPGSYFVLGDNRDNSTDSRVADIGFVPRDRFIGRVAWLLYSVDPGTRELRPERLLQAIR